jgi:hypothetical protein
MSVGDLYRKSVEFERAAGELRVSRVSTQENNDPVLKQLSDIKLFDDRIKFAKDHWKFLGEGSSRTAFEINDELIIKVSHNDKGLAQTKVEMNPEAQRDCTVPVVVADAEGKWVVIRNSKPLPKTRFKELVGFGFDPFMDALYYKFNNETDEKPPREYDEIEKHPLFICVAELIFSTDQQAGDILKPSSWRELDGKPVISDYGLDRETYQSLYNTDSSSSSSTPKSSS